MTQYSIILGQELTIHNATLESGDQVGVNSHGNGNALGNTLVTAGIFNLITLADFVADLEASGSLQRGHTYVALAIVDPDLGGNPAELVVTETQSGKIGGLEISDFGSFMPQQPIVDHVLTFT
jgi:hypothetical protein